jgi:hypothetical protein
VLQYFMISGSYFTVTDFTILVSSEVLISWLKIHFNWLHSSKVKKFSLSSNWPTFKHQISCSFLHTHVHAMGMMEFHQKFGPLSTKNTNMENHWKTNYNIWQRFDSLQADNSRKELSFFSWKKSTMVFWLHSK